MEMFRTILPLFVFCCLCTGIQIQQQARHIQKLQSENSNLTSQVDLLQKLKFSDCSEWLNYDRSSGIKTIYVDPTTPLTVYCDQHTEGGGWTVFQRRADGSVDFYRTWIQYDAGFGHHGREFWLGLRSLRLLTSRRPYELRVDLTSFNNRTGYATYSNFSVGDSSDFYRLYLDFYTGGTAGDCLSNYDQGMQFSTHDADHDSSSSNCAIGLHGAWWYRDCSPSNLNGRYKHSRQYGSDGMAWYAFDNWYALKSTEMKIRPM